MIEKGQELVKRRPTKSGWRALVARLSGSRRWWPDRCFVCAEACRSMAVCEQCLSELTRIGEDHCPQCALPAPGGQRCGGCLKRSPYFDESLAIFVYAHPVREMILAAKSGDGFHILPFLAHALDAALCLDNRSFDRDFDCIVPMPLHAARLRERGFNQSVELAKRLARLTGWPLRRFSVVRDLDTRHQTGLRLKERRRNVKGAFRCIERFDGMRVLVLDDVMTSGSSLNELARTLKLAGAAKVSNLVVARALAQK